MTGTPRTIDRHRTLAELLATHSHIGGLALHASDTDNWAGTMAVMAAALRDDLLSDDPHGPPVIIITETGNGDLIRYEGDLTAGTSPTEFARVAGQPIDHTDETVVMFRVP